MYIRFIWQIRGFQMNRVPRDKLLFIPADLMNGISNENAEIVTKYVQEMLNEGLSKRHCSNSGLWAAMLAKRTNKPFKKMTRDNIIEFLNSFIIPEDQDPLWKSTGTYNLIRICIRRFFRWLYNPNVSSSKRKTLSPPKVIENIPTRVRRKGREIYKHSDLWTQEDVALFLKYSRYLRDSAYVAMAHETSARPHELLRLKIKDIEDKIMPNNVSYTGFIASGKTGERELVLINSIPIVRKWIDAHPQSANPNAALFYSKKKNMGIETLESIFKKYKEKHFPALLNTDIPEDDKQKIKELIKKPWNPYIFRHTDLTNKTRFLIEAELEQHAGWRPGSKMRVRCQHLVGNEYNEAILRRAGKIPPKDEEKDMLKPKECPKCGEPNEPNARWCHKCKEILSLKGYLEALESVKKKDQERDNTIEALRKQMRDIMESYKK